MISYILSLGCCPLPVPQLQTEVAEGERHVLSFL